MPRDRKVDAELIDSAILFVDGGSNGKNPPSQDDTFVKIGRVISSITGLMYVNIKQIPNESLVFLNDWKSSRTEDAIIALTWRHFLDFPDQPEWLVRFPMVKACLRAMDMASEFSQQELGGPPITRWAVTGASKRGWTTWLTAAADPERVKAASPIVLDLLNMQPNLRHMWENTGNWSFTFYDYWIEDVNKRLDDPNFPAMEDLIDPYAYRKRLTMPKMVVSSTGDEFFMPDDTHMFWDELPEPKYFRLLANAEHSTSLSSLSSPHFAFSFRQFVLAAFKNYPMPTFSWRRWDNPEEKTGGIELYAETPIKQIYGWVGDTRTNFRRDFRVAGVRDNQNGAFLRPEFPDLPPGYPDMNPNCPGESCAKTKRVPEQEQAIKMHFDPIDCDNDPYVDELACEYFKNITGEDLVYGTDSTSNPDFISHKKMDESWQVPLLDPEDVVNFQIQANLWRRVMAHQVSEKVWRLEFHEATDAFRGFFFQVAFQGPDDLQSFEFTSEVQIIPTKRPFAPCHDEECQGSLI